MDLMSIYPVDLDKQRLSRVVSEVLELPYDKRQGEAYRIVKAIQKVLTDALRREDRVRIAGLGTFTVRTVSLGSRYCRFYPYPWKKGVHSELLLLREKKYVHFEPNKALVRKLNEKEDTEKDENEDA